MKLELDTTGQHRIFGHFVALPERGKTLPSHLVSKIKCDGTGNVQRFKGRLVCGGSHQIDHIDYQATYPPTAQLGHIALALAIAAKYDPEIHQMDVSTAFFGNKLEGRDLDTPAQGIFLFGPNWELAQCPKIKDFPEDGTPLEKVSLWAELVLAHLVWHFQRLRDLDLMCGITCRLRTVHTP